MKPDRAKTHGEKLGSFIRILRERDEVLKDILSIMRKKVLGQESVGPDREAES